MPITSRQQNDWARTVHIILTGKEGVWMTRDYISPVVFPGIIFYQELPRTHDIIFLYVIYFNFLSISLCSQYYILWHTVQHPPPCSNFVLAVHTRYYRLQSTRSNFEVAEVLEDTLLNRSAP